MIFFSLISTALSSIFYGFVVTITLMALLYVVLKSISKGIVRTPVFYTTGFVLAVLLLIQTSLLIGAVQAKDATDAAKIFLTQKLEGCQGIVSAQESQQVMDAVTEAFPLIGTYADIADFSGNDLTDLPEVVHSTLIDYLNSFIWYRVWWSLGIVILACLVVMLFDKRALASTASTGKSTRKAPKTAARKNYDDF